MIRGKSLKYGGRGTIGGVKNPQSWIFLLATEMNGTDMGVNGIG
jgi:hypothetical protein